MFDNTTNNSNSEDKIRTDAHCLVELQRQLTFVTTVKRMQNIPAVEPSSLPVVQLTPFTKEWRREKSLVPDSPRTIETTTEDPPIDLKLSSVSELLPASAPVYLRLQNDGLPPPGPKRMLPLTTPETGIAVTRPGRLERRLDIREKTTVKSGKSSNNKLIEFPFIGGFAPSLGHRESTTLRDIEQGYCEPLGSGGLKRRSMNGSSPRSNSPLPTERSVSPLSVPTYKKFPDLPPQPLRRQLTKSGSCTLKPLDWFDGESLISSQSENVNQFSNAFGFFRKDGMAKGTLPEIQVQHAVLRAKSGRSNDSLALSHSQNLETSSQTLVKVGFAEEAIDTNKKALGIERQITREAKINFEMARKDKGSATRFKPSNSFIRQMQLGPPTRGELKLKKGFRCNSMRRSNRISKRSIVLKQDRRIDLSHKESLDSGIQSSEEAPDEFMLSGQRQNCGPVDPIVQCVDVVQTVDQAQCQASRATDSRPNSSVDHNHPNTPHEHINDCTENTEEHLV